jgi:endogenous inhibitor of DNA gyrase (YacG/DUF329 family)
MTKERIYEEICKNSKSILLKSFSRIGRSKGLSNCEILCEYFDIPVIKTYTELRLFLTGDSGKCEICGKPTKLKNGNTIHSIFNQFCSKECELKWRSKRQKENNTSNRIKNRKKWKENLSKSLKFAISEGRFTPNVTNSWCNSRIKLKVGNKIINVRSSWEAYFYLKNPTFEYEKVRIPYKDHNGIDRIYIVDFNDKDGNLFEIKPSSKLGECSEKILAAKKYSETHNKKFIIIDENYFRDIDLNLFNGQPDEKKLKKLFSRYEN